MRTMLLIGMGFLLLGSAGCGDDDRRRSRGGSGGGTSAGEEGMLNPDVPLSSEVAEAREVVEALLEAGRRGAADAARALCTSYMAQKIKDSEPRQFTATFYDGYKRGPSVYIEYRIQPEQEVEDGPDKFIMTYRLVSTDDGWRVAEHSPRVEWDQRGRI